MTARLWRCSLCGKLGHNKRTCPKGPGIPRIRHPAVWDLVRRDMGARDRLGRKRYGTRLRPHNGRDMLLDLFEELLDAVAYVRGVMYERDGR